MVVTTLNIIKHYISFLVYCRVLSAGSEQNYICFMKLLKSVIFSLVKTQLDLGWILPLNTQFVEPNITLSISQSYFCILQAS